MIIQLINNVSLLVMLAVGLQMLSRYVADESFSFKILAGLLYAFVGIIAISTPYELQPGIIFDGRTIVLTMAGLFGGPITVAIPGVICAGYRAYLGGVGAPVGVVTILVAGAVGATTHYMGRSNPKWFRPFRLWLLGFFVHGIMVFLFFFIPDMTPGMVMRELGFNFLVIHPLAFLILALVILEGEKRLAAERALQQSEQDYRNLFQNHSAVKLLIDPKSGAIRDANKSAAQYYGWSRKELRTMTIHDLDTAPADQIWRHLQDMDSDCHLEARHRHADGQVHDVRIFHSNITFRSKPCLHAIVLDASKERLLEEQLRQAQKMEAIGHLAGGIAHDFNNSLQTTLGYTQLLKELDIRAANLRDHSDNQSAFLKEITDLEQSQQHYLDQINQSCVYAASLTRQLLTFSKRQIMQPTLLNINHVTEHMLKMLRHFLGEQIQLDFLPTSQPGSIHADSGMIEQVLMNLTINARDAMPEGGTLTIETRPISFDAAYCAAHPWAKPGNYILLRVSDTGCGMDQDTKDHIFEPFFTTKAPGKGTGLGLATVYGIVKQHKGLIQVYSEPGFGAAFNIYFPMTDAKAPEASEIEENPEVQGGTETILLAEDNEMVRKLAAHILENAGYTVLKTANGVEAVTCFEAHNAPIHLLFFDVVMPEMNGRDAYARIQTLNPGVPVLYTSGYNETAIHNDFVVHEGVHLLQKPYPPRQLLQMVRQCLDNAQTQPESV